MKKNLQQALSFSFFGMIGFTRKLIQATLVFIVLLCSSYGVNAANYSVTNTNDAGAGSLRQAILDANTAAGADIIDVTSVNGTITLSSTLPDITEDLTITGPGANILTISGNNAIQVFNIINNSSLYISGLTIANGSSSSNGGAISFSGSGSLFLLSCTFSNNSVSGSGISGGAIYSTGSLVIQGCTFSNNTSGSGNGGAIATYAFGSACITDFITNSTFNDNSAAYGGAVALGGNWFLHYCTISGNTASIEGGGIYDLNQSGQTVAGRFFSSIVALNTAPTNHNVGNSGGNLVAATNSVMDGSGESIIASPTNVFLDPLLGPLQDNGGPNFTMALLSGSPAINSGASLINIAGQIISAPHNDQRGYARPQSGSFDAGAFETGASTPQAGTPYIITNFCNLAPFNSCSGTASAEQSFRVSGINMADAILVTPPAGFEVSTSAGAGFGSSVALPLSGGIVNTISVYVRLTASASGAPSGNITCTSTNANARTQAVSGTVNTNTMSTAPTGATGITSVCSGSSTLLSVSGGIKGTGATTEWFTGSCGGTPAGTGDVITVSPTNATVYYVRYSNTCNTTFCAPVTITISVFANNRAYVNASASGANNGTSWTDAFTDLQSALAITGTCGITEIWVAAGTYKPDEGSGQTNNSVNSTFALKNGVAIYGGFTGTETTLADRNWRTNVTILSGDIDGDNTIANNAFHVTTGSGTDNTAVLDGFTITGGNAICTGTCSAGGQWGGGMLNISGSPTVSNCIFTTNIAAQFGGGMANINSSPIITNCIFSGNSYSLVVAEPNAGGGMYNQGSFPSLVNCIFSGNSAGTSGGGMYNTGTLNGHTYIASAPSITNCTFSGNSAYFNSTGGSVGGGIANASGNSGYITNCIFWNNRDNSGTGTASASFNGTSIINYSLLQGQNPAGTGNLDGTNVANNPLFIIAVDPTTAPSTAGDLHLQTGSPLINAGTNTGAPSTDIEGNPRLLTVANPADMGAYEVQCITNPIGGGAATVCAGSTTPAFTDETAGGTWSILNGTGSASITTGGVVTGGNPGTVTVQYSVSDCGTTTVTFLLTVNGAPLVAAIGGGATTVCAGSATPAFTDETAGGTWSILNGTGSASITTGGVVTGGNPGTVTVQYSVSDCGTTTVTSLLTINPIPTADPASLTVNDNDADGFASFTLTDADPTVGNAQSGISITYYASLADANSNANVLISPYTNTTAFAQTIYARVQRATGCYATSQVTLMVTPANCSATGNITYQVWNNIGNGLTVSSLTSNINYPKNPTSSTLITSMEGITNQADNYGSRIVGYLCAPATGSYNFWIASDDYGELWLSTNDQPANRQKIAYVNGYTLIRQWNKYATQKSAVINLVQGQKYFIEALMKEAGGKDDLAVGWLKPGQSGSVPSEVIPASVLSPFGTIFVSSVTLPPTLNINAGSAVMLPATVLPANASNQILNWTTSNPTVALVNSFGFVTGISPGIATISATSTDGSNKSGTSVVTVTGVTTICSATGNITYQVWNNIGNSVAVSSLTSNINYPNNPTSSTLITSMEGITDLGDSYGARIVGYICAPATGSYTFWIASDDYGELWLSTDDQPTNKQKIAYVNGYTWIRQWNKYATQKSAVFNLVQGQKYYIEALMKEATGHDNLAVGWLKPGESGSMPSEVIPGSVLSPFGTILVSSVTLPPTLNLNTGASASLSATVLPSNASNKILNWTTSDPTIALVNSNGLVTGISSGMATISATSTDGSNKSGTSVVTVTGVAMSCSASGNITYQVWNNIANSVAVSSLTSNINYPNNPTSSSLITSMEGITDLGDSYGARIAGYICAPATGSYTFWIASDDYGELWLSTDDQPANKQKIAYVNGYTWIRQWNKYVTQKSAVINLVQGQKYYIEALMKEATGHDNLAVGWLKPGQSGTVPSEVIPGSVLSPFGTILVSSVTLPPTLNLNTGASASLTATVLPSNASNKILNWTTSDPTVALVNSNGLVTGISSGIATISATSTDGSNKSGSSVVTVTGVAISCSATGNITYQVWNNIGNSTLVSSLTGNINYPNNPTSSTLITSMEGIKDQGDSYGARIVGYICAPSSGSYTFWIASDDYGELWLSTNDQPANKQKIAYVNGYTLAWQWNKYATQKSAVINLVQGQKYYIEALMKEGTGHDNLAVGWLKPGQSGIVPSEVIPGSALSPYGTILVSSVTLPPTLNLNTGASASLPATVLPSNASNKILNWTTSDPTVALVNSNGLVTGISPGIATISATSTDGSNKSGTSVVTVTGIATICSATGNITYQVWNNIGSSTLVSSLTGNINYPNNPTSSILLTSMEGITDQGDSYGARIAGYICAPATGSYTFWIASDDYGELWLSTNDQPANKQKIAYVNGYTWIRTWNKYATQKSATINLVQGQKYYIEALMKEGTGHDNLAVGWLKPGQPGTVPSEVIPGSVLSPLLTPVKSDVIKVENPATPDKDVMLRVYPNPLITNVLNIKLENLTSVATLRIFTISGVKCYEEIIQNSGIILVDRSVFKSGMYIIKVENEYFVKTAKLIVN